jgi:hypothetical protein
MGFPGLGGWRSCKWCRQPALVFLRGRRVPVQHDLVVASFVPLFVLLDPVRPVAIKRSCRPFAVEAITTEPFGQTTERGDWPGYGLGTLHAILLSILAISCVPPPLPFVQGCPHRLCFISGGYTVEPVHRGHDVRSHSLRREVLQTGRQLRAFPRSNADVAAGTR